MLNKYFKSGLTILHDTAWFAKTNMLIKRYGVDLHEINLV